MSSCGISILNETKQTNETQTVLSVLCNAPCLAAKFFCQFVSWRVQFCGDDLLKGSGQTTETSSFPEHVHVCQSICFFGLVLHTTGNAQ